RGGAPDGGICPRVPALLLRVRRDPLAAASALAGRDQQLGATIARDALRAPLRHFCRCAAALSECGCRGTRLCLFRSRPTPGDRAPGAAAEPRAAPIPQLLLQPLMENALVHGIASSLEGGWIEVQARVRDGRLQVLIRNTVGGRSQPGLGVGIANARARLKYLYSDDASLDFRLEQDGALAIISLTLPAFAAVVDEDSDEPAPAARASVS